VAGSAIFVGDPLLDIAPWVGTIKASFQWELVTRGSLAQLGEIHPMRDVTPRMENQTSRAIKRSVSNVVLPPDEVADIDLFNDRVRVAMVLEDGRRTSLGVFMFLAPAKQISSRPIPLATRLVDQGWQLDQKTKDTFGVVAGGSPLAALRTVIAQAGFTEDQLQIEGSDATTGDPISWQAGTSRARIANDLARLSAYYSVYFDRDGKLIARPVNELQFSPTVEYLPVDSRVFADSIEETTTLLEAPNVYVVVNNGATADSVHAEFYVPSDAPHSVANTGFERAEVIRMQGIPSTAAALEIAKARAFQSPGDFRRVTLTSPPDPRHDTYDFVLWDGELWREVSWSMELRSGGAMRHELRKVL